MAALSSAFVKSPDQLALALAALEREDTSREVRRTQEVAILEELGCDGVCCHWAPGRRCFSACQPVDDLPCFTTGVGKIDRLNDFCPYSLKCGIQLLD